MGINTTTFNGRLGADAEGQDVKNDGYLSTFSLANSRKFKDRDGDTQEETVWLRCAWFGNGAKALNQYLTKGRDITVRGRLTENTWNDKETGEKRSRIELRVEELDLHGDGNGGGDKAAGSPAAKKSTASKRAAAAANVGGDDEKMPWED